MSLSVGDSPMPGGVAVGAAVAVAVAAAVGAGDCVGVLVAGANVAVADAATGVEVEVGMGVGVGVGVDGVSITRDGETVEVAVGAGVSAGRAVGVTAAVVVANCGTGVPEAASVPHATRMPATIINTKASRNRNTIAVTVRRDRGTLSSPAWPCP